MKMKRYIKGNKDIPNLDCTCGSYGKINTNTDECDKCGYKYEYILVNYKE